jgi:mRNA interferase YafO
MNKDVKVFVSSEFRESMKKEKIDLLITRFKSYKQTGIPHETFGRDTTYDFPDKVKKSGMFHIHIKDNSSKKWNLKKISFDRTSDTALIYCEGFLNRNYFLLLGFLDNAHLTYSRNPLYLLELSDIADKFRERF